jgi:hypothetical protein
MSDPTGRFGALQLAGWIGDAPTGNEEAFLLMTTSGMPEVAAEVTMPVVADILGLDANPGAVTTHPRADVRVEVRADSWVTLHIPGGERFERPVSQEWAALARKRGQVVLVVGYAPMSAGLGEEEYLERHAAQVVIGLVPAS